MMHPIGPELPISAHVACARVCWQLYVLRASHALVQATVGVGTVIIVYIGVAYTRGGDTSACPFVLYRASRTRQYALHPHAVLSCPNVLGAKRLLDGIGQALESRSHMLF